MMAYPSTVDRMRELLAVLKPEQLEIRDDSRHHAGHAGAADGGGHYKVTIVSEAFRDRKPLERHRLVHEALAPLMRHEIHALALETHVPDNMSNASFTRG